MATMAEQLQQQQQRQQPLPPQEGFKSLLPEKGPTTSQVLAVVAIFPLGGLLLLLAGLALTGTLIGLTVATPLFVIFSPVLVPAAFTVALAVGGFLTAGAFGLTAVSSFSLIFKYLRRVGGGGGGGGFQQAEQQRVEDTAAGGFGQKARETAGDLVQKARETGQTIKSKAQETVKT